MLDQLKKSSFDPHVKSKFEIHPEGMDMVEVELVQVTEKKSEYVENFSLIFHGVKDKEFGQGVHKVKHPKMGEFEIFLVPIAFEKEKDEDMYYQAVFSRLLKDDDDD